MQSQTTHLQGRSWLWEPDLPGPAAFSSMGTTVDTVRPLAEEKIPIRKASCARAQVSRHPPLQQRLLRRQLIPQATVCYCLDIRGSQPRPFCSTGRTFCACSSNPTQPSYHHISRREHAQAQQLRLGSDWVRLDGRAECTSTTICGCSMWCTHLLPGRLYTVGLAMALSGHTRGSSGAQGLPAAA